jgi:hypothetical protein
MLAYLAAAHRFYPRVCVRACSGVAVATVALANAPVTLSSPVCVHPPIRKGAVVGVGAVAVVPELAWQRARYATAKFAFIRQYASFSPQTMPTTADATDIVGGGDDGGALHARFDALLRRRSTMNVHTTLVALTAVVGTAPLPPLQPLSAAFAAVARSLHLTTTAATTVTATTTTRKTKAVKKHAFSDALSFVDWLCFEIDANLCASSSSSSSASSSSSSLPSSSSLATLSAADADAAYRCACVASSTSSLMTSSSSSSLSSSREKTALRLFSTLCRVGAFAEATRRRRLCEATADASMTMTWSSPPSSSSPSSSLSSLYNSTFYSVDEVATTRDAFVKLLALLCEATTDHDATMMTTTTTTMTPTLHWLARSTGLAVREWQKTERTIAQQTQPSSLSSLSSSDLSSSFAAAFFATFSALLRALPPAAVAALLTPPLPQYRTSPSMIARVANRLMLQTCADHHLNGGGGGGGGSGALDVVAMSDAAACVHPTIVRALAVLLSTPWPPPTPTPTSIPTGVSTSGGGSGSGGGGGGSGGGDGSSGDAFITRLPLALVSAQVHFAHFSQCLPTAMSPMSSMSSVSSMSSSCETPPLLTAMQAIAQTTRAFADAARRVVVEIGNQNNNNFSDNNGDDDRLCDEAVGVAATAKAAVPRAHADLCAHGW